MLLYFDFIFLFKKQVVPSKAADVENGILKSKQKKRKIEGLRVGIDEWNSRVSKVRSPRLGVGVFKSRRS